MPASDLLIQAFSREALLACTGYDPSFIHGNTTVGFDTILKSRHKRTLPQVLHNPDGVLHYTALSVLFNRERKVPMVSAYNIDGASKGTGIKRAPGFKADFRIDKNLMLDYPFYDLRKDITEFEIGHMAANNEMAWGAHAQLQAYQTFHFTNSVPQAEGLNTGLWKSLESYMIREAANVPGNKKICVFSGPVLMDQDPQYIKDPAFRIPLLFYKIIVFMNKKGLYSTGFLMSHEKRLRALDMFVRSRDLITESQPFSDFAYNQVFQVNMEDIESLTGMNFRWPGVSRVAVPLQKNRVQNIKSIGSSEDARKLQEARSKPLLRGVSPVDDTPSEEDIPVADDGPLSIILP